MEKNKMYDVIVIGAGASGLMAACELGLTGKSVLVLEAKEKAGGRIHTIRDKSFELPVELGAEFIHGDLKLTRMLMKKAGLSSYQVKGEIWRKENDDLQKSDFIEDYRDLEKKFKALKEDLPVKDFLEQFLAGEKYEELRTSLRSYVEGYYAADTSRASTMALKEELQNSDEEQYRLDEGYSRLVEYLLKEAKNSGVSIYYDSPVQLVRWEKGKVEVQTSSGIFRSGKVLVTVSVGVLQADAIQFVPALPSIRDAVKKLGFGPVIKILLQFKTAFWKEKTFTDGKDVSSLGFLFSEEKVPTWWTYHPKNAAMITGWIGGPDTAGLEEKSVEEMIQLSLTALGRIFSSGPDHLKEMLKGAQVFNWIRDPFTCGGYSYETIGGQEAKAIINQPVQDTIYFAGEGLHQGPEIGTVEAALVTGREMAHQMVAAF